MLNCDKMLETRGEINNSAHHHHHHHNQSIDQLCCINHQNNNNINNNNHEQSSSSSSSVKGGKSSTKSKEKRLQRKREQQRLGQAMQVVSLANKLADPLAPFPVFRSYNNTKHGLDATLYVKRYGDLDETVRMWLFNLTKRNMQMKYEKCSWGWSDAKKQEELWDDAAWYLVAQQASSSTTNDDEDGGGKLLGFSHFRFDIDEGMEVLYCYELQLELFVQRKGLGKFMMQTLELIAFKNNMKKVVLTVLKNNQSMKFFKALNYTLDESSPIDDEIDTYPYEILSKINKRLAGTLLLPQPPTPLNNSIVAAGSKKGGGGHHCCTGHHHH